MPCSQDHAQLKAPLEAVEEGGGGFPEREAVARLQVLAAEGCRGTGELPGVGEVAFSQVVRAQESPAMRAGGTPRASES